MKILNEIIDFAVQQKRNIIFWLYFLFLIIALYGCSVNPITNIWLRLFHINLNTFLLSLYILNFIFYKKHENFKSPKKYNPSKVG